MSMPPGVVAFVSSDNSEFEVRWSNCFVPKACMRSALVPHVARPVVYYGWMIALAVSHSFHCKLHLLSPHLAAESRERSSPKEGHLTSVTHSTITTTTTIWPSDPSNLMAANLFIPSQIFP
jgi:hypothetical protein